MKQHITVEQLFELPDYKLAEVMDKEFQDIVQKINYNTSDTDWEAVKEVLRGNKDNE